MMNLEAVTIQGDKTLMVRLGREIIDRAIVLITRLKCLIATRYVSCLRTVARTEVRANSLSLIPPSQPSRFSCLLSNALDAVHGLNTAADSAPEPISPELGFLISPSSSIGNQPLVLRLVAAAKSFSRDAAESRPVRQRDSGRASAAAPGEGDYRNLPFLGVNGAVSFPKRLGNEVLALVTGLARDPRAFFDLAGSERAVAKDRRKRIRTGFGAAAVVYAAVLASAYVSHTRTGRRPEVPGQEDRSSFVLLAPPPPLPNPPAPAKREPEEVRHRDLKRDRPVAPPKAAPTGPPPAGSIENVPIEVASNPEGLKQGAAAPATGSLASGKVNGDGGPDSGANNSPGGSGAGHAPSVNYDAVFSITGVTSRPRISSRPMPGYTDDARRNQIEGLVKVSVVLRSDGTVGDARIVKGLGHGLDEKALDAARHLQFIPAEKDGRKVSLKVFLEFRFSLL